MSANYDFVITSGGIGPTHDDITYQSIARAFDLPLVLHEGAYEKMKKLSRPHPSNPNFDWNVDSPARKAKLRMIELPYDKELPDEDQVIFASEDLWVPINVVNGNVHIFPGIPRLFEKMLTGLKPRLLPRLTDPEGKGVHRILFSTGSYPRWGKSKNTVTLVGRDQEFMESLVAEVEKGVSGSRIQTEGEDDDSQSDKEA
jgi:molybdopterin-biosynthesis enzyme MoeA-like protein